MVTDHCVPLHTSVAFEEVQRKVKLCAADNIAEKGSKYEHKSCVGTCNCISKSELYEYYDQQSVGHCMLKLSEPSVHVAVTI
jgi:hypothetical protein